MEDFDSYRFFDFPLCTEHLKWIKKIRNASKPAKLLYLGLKLHGIPVVLEFDDNGHKKVDIGIPQYNIFIEVDGPEHYKIPQALTDLQRTLFSWKDDIHTIRIPNNLVKSQNNREKVVKFISSMLMKYGKPAKRTISLAAPKKQETYHSIRNIVRDLPF